MSHHGRRTAFILVKVGGMNDTVLISISGVDRTGLVAALAGRLFDLGCNLGDTTFAVLGEGAQFTSLCILPEGLAVAALATELEGMPELAGSKISVRRFDLEPLHGPSAKVTHRIVLSGGDRPGLIARLSEVFVQFDANIVRMNSERTPAERGNRYVTRFAVSIPSGREKACLATVRNTAGELSMTCVCEDVGSPRTHPLPSR